MIVADNRRGVKRYPFRDGAQGYRELGWTGTIPVTRNGTKAPLARGITGADGVDADDKLLTFLVRKYGWANIGLRLPFGIVGLDVDDYDGKSGGRTFRSLNGRLGPLQTTWRSTSRAPEDSVSGIYLFRAPRESDWLWVSDLGTGSGIEIAQYHHRFATVAPSRHNQTGRPYAWWRGDRPVSAPRPEELPLLPVSWARYLLSSRKYRAGGSATAIERSEWWERVSGGEMCPWMDKSAREQAAEVRRAAETSGLHDATKTAVYNLCWNSQDGHTGLERALAVVEREFARARRDRDLRTEWEGFVRYATARAAGGKQEYEDSCELASVRPRKRSGRERVTGYVR